MRIASNPKHNEWYEELCALGAIGELSGQEFEELQRHLAECRECRELSADFRRISASDMGLVSVLKQSQPVAESAIDEHELLGRLLARAERERAKKLRSIPEGSSEKARPSPRATVTWLIDWFRRPALSYGVIALSFCALAAIAVYRFRAAQRSPVLENLQGEVQSWKSRAEEAAKAEESKARLLSDNQSEREALRSSLAEAQAKYRTLEAAQRALESELAAARAETGEKTRELEAAQSDAQEGRRQMASLEARLESAVEQTEQQRTVADALRSKLLLAEQGTQPSAGHFTDLDAKNLFGARELHIVDVYDVDSKGENKRTYGRVYYAEKKLLIFYAFDLEGKRKDRAPASFQAWGYRQANESKPENLGLFSVDDASANRWVLKVSNPGVLEHIDAVFVTLESPNGSASPRGRKLLYANLAGPSNHP